jgi:hypothetical protein
VLRRFYEVRVSSGDVAGMVLTAGQRLQAFTAREILTGPRFVPYDAYAIWMHATKNLI